MKVLLLCTSNYNSSTGWWDPNCTLTKALLVQLPVMASELSSLLILQALKHAPGASIEVHKI
jgi:hypothetical protein